MRRWILRVCLLFSAAGLYGVNTSTIFVSGRPYSTSDTSNMHLQSLFFWFAPSLYATAFNKSFSMASCNECQYHEGSFEAAKAAAASETKPYGITVSLTSECPPNVTGDTPRVDLLVYNQGCYSRWETIDVSSRASAFYLNPGEFVCISISTGTASHSSPGAEYSYSTGWNTTVTLKHTYRDTSGSSEIPSNIYVSAGSVSGSWYSAPAGSAYVSWNPVSDAAFPEYPALTGISRYYIRNNSTGTVVSTDGTNCTLPVRAGENSVTITPMDKSGNIGLPGSFVMYVDHWVPSPPPNVRLNLIERQYRNPWGVVFFNSTYGSPEVVWDPAYDAGSGVAGYYYDLSATPSAFTTRTNSSVFYYGNGSYIAYVRSVDAVGHVSSDFSYTKFNVDNTPPDTPRNISCSPQSGRVQYMNSIPWNGTTRAGYLTTQSRFNVSWESGGDANPPETWQSGMKLYTVGYRNGWLTERIEITDTNTRTVSMNLSVLSVDGAGVLICVGAEDLVGNSSTSGEILVVLDNAAAEPAVTGSRDIRKKADGIRWRPVQDIAGVREYSVFLAPYDGPGKSLTVMPDGSVRKPDGGVVACGPAYDGATGYYSLPVSVFDTVFGKNFIPAAVPVTGYVQAVDSLGNVSPSSARSSSVRFILDNVPVTLKSDMFQSVPVNGGTYATDVPDILYDSDIDPVDGNRFSVDARILREEYEYRASTATKRIRIPEDFSSGGSELQLTDGSYEVVLTAVESCAVFDESRPDGIAWISRTNSDAPLKIPFIVDSSPPTAEIVLIGNGTASPGYTGTSEILLLLQNIGDNLSGVRRIEIGNSDPRVGYGEPAELRIPPSPGNSREIVLSDAIPAEGLEEIRNGKRLRLLFQSACSGTLEISGWPLYRQDGTGTVIVSPSDLLGNASEIPCSIVLDTVKPPAPSYRAYSHGSADELGIWTEHRKLTLKFLWNESPDAGGLREYLVSCFSDGRTISEASTQPCEAVLPLDPEKDGVGWNSAVRVEVRATDRAGNVSDPLGVYVCTRAEPGAIDRFGPSDRSYDEGVHGLRLALRSKDGTSGLLYTRSSNQSIELFHQGTHLQTLTLTDEKRSDVFSRFGPHMRGIGYRVVALNDFGDAFESEVAELSEIPNLEPVPVRRVDLTGIPVGAGRYSRKILAFDTSLLPVQDDEGDILRYAALLKTRSGERTVPFPFPLTGGLFECDLDDVFGGYVDDGSEVLWALTVQDVWTSDAGESTGRLQRIPGAADTWDTVIVDRTAPRFDHDYDELIAEDSAGPLNAAVLTVSGIGDPVSASGTSSGLRGLVSFDFQFRDGENNVVAVSDAVAVTDGLAGIELPHGTYSLLLSVSDAVGNVASCQLGDMIVDHVPPVIEPSGTALVNVKPSAGGTAYLGSPVLNLRFAVSDPGFAPPGTPALTGAASGFKRFLYRFTDAASGTTLSDPRYPGKEPTVCEPRVLSSDESPARAGLTGTFGIDCPYLPEGTAYRLHLIVRDEAGNTSAETVLGPFAADRSRPVVASYAAEGKIRGVNGGLYVSTFRDLRYSLPSAGIATDPESGLETVSYRLEEVDTGTVVGGAETDDGWKPSLDGLTPVAGKKYRTGVRVVNGAGLSAVAYDRESFVYDPIPPTIGPIAVSPSGAVVPGMTILVRIPASDGESGISSYRISLLNGATGENAGRFFSEDDLLSDCTLLTTGTFEILAYGGKEGSFVLRVPADLPAGGYTIFAEVANAAALNATRSCPCTVNVGRSAAAVHVPSPFSSSTSVFPYSWSLVAGSPPSTGYSCRLIELPEIPGGDETVLVSETFPSDAVQGVGRSFSGIRLSCGRRYCVELTAAFADARPVSFRSIEVLVDDTGPIFARDSDDAFRLPRFSTGSSLLIEWGAEDPESDIASASVKFYHYLPPRIDRQALDLLVASYPGPENPSIMYSFYLPGDSGALTLRGSPGTPPLSPSEKAFARCFFMNSGYSYAVGGSIPVPVRETSTVVCRSSDGEPLSFSTGDEVFALLSLTNGAGLRSDRTAGPVAIDNSPPPDFEVFPSSPVYDTVQSIDATWTVAVDPESGISEYACALLTDPADAYERDTVWSSCWKGTGGLPIVPLVTMANPGVPGHPCYAAVRAVNHAGLERIEVGSAVILDSTAPRVPVIRILRAVQGPSGETIESGVGFVSSTDGLTARIRCDDLESGIRTISADAEVTGASDPPAGMLEHVPYSDAAVPPAYEKSKTVILPLDGSALEEEALRSSPDGFRIRVRSVNFAGLTGEALSQIFMYVPGTPGFEYVRGAGFMREENGEWKPDKLCFFWNPKEGSVPSVNYSVRLLRDGAYIGRPVDLYQNRSWSAPVTDIGLYQLELTAFGLNGSSSVVRSTPVLLTAAKPLIRLVEVPEFVDGTIVVEVELRGTDPAYETGNPSLLPGVDECLYRFGSYDDRDAFSGGWKSLGAGFSLVTGKLTGDTARAVHGNETFGTIRIRNSLGVWSEREIYGIRADHTPPAAVSVETGYAFSNATDAFGGITVGGAEDLSGLSYFVLGVRENSPGSEIAWSEGDRYVLSETDDAFSFVLPECVVAAPSLLESREYRIAVRFVNGAGTRSGVLESDPIHIDRTPPVLTFFAPAGIESYEDAGNRRIHVYNAPPFIVDYSVADALDPSGGTVEYVVESESGVVLGSGDTGGPVLAGTVTETPGPDEAVPYGMYLVRARAADSAGNSEEYALSFRYNSPPMFSLPTEYASVVPGKPSVFVSNGCEDPEGDSPLLWIWFFGSTDPSGTEESSAGTGSGSPEGPEFPASAPHAYPQNGDDQETIRTVRLRAVDRWGAFMEKSSTVAVKVTEEGTLYADEIWKDVRPLRGTVTVPAGLRLTVLPGTTVLAAAGAELLVRGGLSAKGSSDRPVTFTSEAAASTVDWKGIRLDGDAPRLDLEVAEISFALRGLTVSPGSRASIGSCFFLNNRTGIHAWGESVSVADSVFRGNEWYAIKEDAVRAHDGRRPSVTGCRFSSNGYDYYHELLRTITVGKLNGLEFCHSNIGE